MDLVRLGLERGDTAAGAVQVITDHLDRYGQGGSGHDEDVVARPRPYWSSFLVADPTEAWVIETSGAAWVTERVGTHDTAVRAISNRTTIPDFDRVHRHPRQAVERFVDPRWHASQVVLANRPVTRDRLAAHLRSHDSCGEAGWSVCMHVSGIEATTASMIAELRGDGAPHSAWVLVGHPCETDYQRVVVGEPFAAIRCGTGRSARVRHVIGTFGPGAGLNTSLGSTARS